MVAKARYQWLDDSKTSIPEAIALKKSGIKTSEKASMLLSKWLTSTI
jgi:hypothetical protein